jgi:hypothetical protein
LRMLRRILIAIVVTLAVILVGVNWIAPVALSFYAAHNAPPVARIVPTDLKDHSVSPAPGTKLSYFGYEFEVPWTDLDETQTRLYPTDKPEKRRVDLRFRSGLRLLLTAVPPREWVNGFPEQFNVSPQKIEAGFGHETMTSDYSFIKAVYEFTPDKMNHWTVSDRGLNRDEFLLMIKSLALLKSADTGIFNLQNSSYKGFQQGNPEVRQDGIAVNLYADDGTAEFMFFQKDYQSPRGVTQSEINRIVQSLRKAAQVTAN